MLSWHSMFIMSARLTLIRILLVHTKIGCFDSISTYKNAEKMPGHFWVKEKSLEVVKITDYMPEIMVQVSYWPPEGVGLLKVLPQEFEVGLAERLPKRITKYSS